MVFMHTMFKGLIISLVISLFTFNLFGCVGPAPREDYTLAHTALDSARACQAPRFAPGFYNQAEEYYRQAVSNYQDRHYQEATQNFVRARQFAEKAENYTVLKKAQTGETE
jgi:hypothetical protein